MKRALRSRQYTYIDICSDEDEDNKEEIKKLDIKKKIKTEVNEKKTSSRGKRTKNVEVTDRKRVKQENVDEDDDNEVIAIEAIPERVKTKAVKRKNGDTEKPQTSNEKKAKLKKDLSDIKNCNEDVSIKLKNIENYSTDCLEWSDIDYISEIKNIDKQVAKNIVKLFKEDNTIPFIARYRRNMTGGMEPDQLRSVKECFDQVKVIKHRAATIIKAIDKLGKWTPQIHSAVVSTKSIDDLEHIYSMFKVGSKQSLAEKAKLLGLGPVSNAILEGTRIPPLSSLINPDKKELQTEQQVKEGIIHIIANAISKNKDTFETVKMLQKTSIMEIQTTQSKAHGVSKEEKKNIDEPKYETYFNFKSNTRIIKPHQILAINRAEAQKVLSIKIIVPDSVVEEFKRYCLSSFRSATRASNLHLTLLQDSIDYAYKKFIKPLIVRRVRSELKEKAENASIEVFITNVKQLLLTSPLRGKIVLGIDPGFYHGCKLAVVSEQGNILETAVIHPHKKTGNFENSAKILVNLVKTYNCTVLALGNATACRETEVFLSKLIKSKAFGSIDISYTIVDEAGASIYSCSPEAKSEFPDLDPNIISAISIARRIQDPLAELVKVEPKHLGVGMYQHDLPEKQLLQALNEVVSEAVSFVGVDINTASHSLLKRVAGLNVTRAANIIEWRSKHGPFLNRQQILDVKGIGSKTFEQCAGFIRIIPETAIITGSKIKSEGSNKSLNFLDQTWIHPESYDIANKILKEAGCNIDKIGSLPFIERIKSYAESNGPSLCKKFQTDEATLEVIIKDIGVGRNGLIPIKWCKGQTLCIGQHVEVKVINIDHSRKRITLQLMKAL
ncbi:hypothetical protein KPH14_003860 [Odynerus spinipes]|uniref:YqgF/RNase H-like domain-containing protein n=1 Tax=Odynerus spinipes TaxID=1348599 RepID=A0AAD9RXH7_9HYME|nr:hypothetical protein KPH14_003860 [Odynerus spinipes]